MIGVQIRETPETSLATGPGLAGEHYEYPNGDALSRR